MPASFTSTDSESEITPDRDEALAFSDLDSIQNASARTIAAQTECSKWRYTTLIVPGAGPEDTALRFRQGMTPFILVSGSAVHPRGSDFFEAVEIRRALIGPYGIPADRIIMEPHALHHDQFVQRHPALR
ncbi:hypothetical protein KY084_14930 [Stakelama sp. CBK3Z-3]|uniref:Uncharacterized protein n=1 Tax=Stakelama flava TaxID=2860338 RepID=A0ABS6XPQ9_9SPHN|nr:hypothetical protein [Stakelama flava]MBW4332156.1 hypothetical protein [Stakelama flava]